MSGVSVRLPDVFIDAKATIEDTLKQSGKLSIKSYRGFFSNFCDVTHFHIEEEEDEEGYSNLDLSITYVKRVMTPNETFSSVEVTKNLRVLTAIGDNQWTYRMINKIWDGNYPSTVAVDMEKGEVYLFNISANRIELTQFGEMTVEEFEIFKYDVHDREPFRIKIDEDAMFDYIDGAEGINHLQKNIIVEFNCGLPLKIRPMQGNPML